MEKIIFEIVYLLSSRIFCLKHWQALGLPLIGDLKRSQGRKTLPKVILGIVPRIVSPSMPVMIFCTYHHLPLMPANECLKHAFVVIFVRDVKKIISFREKQRLGASYIQ